MTDICKKGYAASACFTGLAAYSIIYPDSSKVVILWKNGVVNGVVDTDKVVGIIKAGKMFGKFWG